MSPAQYELLNDTLVSPGSVVVRREVAWNLGRRCTQVVTAAINRGYARLGEPDAAGQRPVVVTDEGKAEMHRWMDALRSKVQP